MKAKYNISLGKVACILLIATIGSFQLKAQSSLQAVTAEGSASTKLDYFTDVTGAEINVEVTDVNYVLLVTSFMATMTSPEEAERVAHFRVVDIDDPENINTGEIRRSFSNPKEKDYGLGSIVYIFDVSGDTGKKTYQLQHAFDNSSRVLNTEATISAISLKSDQGDLLNDVKTLMAPVEMPDSVWSPISDLTTTPITTDCWGGFYVAASLDCLTQSFNTEATAEYKMQYKVNDEPWEDLTTVVNRSMLNSNDYGIINLLGYLPDKTRPGTYAFRVLHQNVSPASDIFTMGGNLVTVFLGNTVNYFPLITGHASDVETTLGTFTDVFEVDLTYELNTSVFLHSQFTMQADSLTIPQYDLFVDGLYDGRDVSRNLEDSFEIGIGVLTGVVSGLLANQTYYARLRHLVIPPGNSLVSAGQMVGFYLTAKENLLPVDLLYFNVNERNSSYNVLTWETVSEKSNDYFTIYRSIDAESWSPIANIPGSGNSLRSVFYEYEDAYLYSEQCYYKLAQTDFDGTTRELSIVSVNGKLVDEKSVISIYPNPVENVIYLEPSITGIKSVQVIGINGQVQLKIHDSLEKGLDVSELGKGNYILLIDGIDPLVFTKQ